MGGSINHEKLLPIHGYKLEQLVAVWESDISTAMEFLKTMLELLNTTPKAVSYKTAKLVTDWDLSINLAY